MSNNLQVANEIIRQLGGMGRLKAMTGAKDFVAIERGVRFRIGGGANKMINLITVKLNGMDTYDVEFGRMRKVKGIPTYKALSTDLNIYNDMLKDSIESNTGMYLTM